MTARLAKEEMALLMPNALAHYFKDDPADIAAPQQPSLFTRLARWIADVSSRRAVLNELEALSDRELADIGLARTDLPTVFDAATAERRRFSI